MTSINPSTPTALAAESPLSEALSRFKGDLVRLVTGIIEHDKALGDERKSEWIFWGYNRDDIDYIRLIFDPEYAKEVTPVSSKISLFSNGRTWDTAMFPGIILNYITPEEYPETEHCGWNIALTLGELRDKPSELARISTISIYESGGVEMNLGMQETTETNLLAASQLLTKAFEEVQKRMSRINSPHSLRE